MCDLPVLLKAWTLPTATATTSDQPATEHSPAAPFPAVRTVPSMFRPIECRHPAAIGPLPSGKASACPQSVVHRESRHAARAITAGYSCRTRPLSQVVRPPLEELTSGSRLPMLLPPLGSLEKMPPA